MKKICVFLGSSPGKNEAFNQAAKALGEAIARNGYTLVYGGTHIGLMKTLADAAWAKNGRVIGVINKAFAERAGVLHPALSGDELILVETMGDRLTTQIEISDAFIAFPGGMGTLDEFTGVWARKKASTEGMDEKTIGLLNTNGVFTHFLEGFHHLVSTGFMQPNELDMLKVSDTPEGLLALLFPSKN